MRFRSTRALLGLSLACGLAGVFSGCASDSTADPTNGGGPLAGSRASTAGGAGAPPVGEGGSAGSASSAGASGSAAGGSGAGGGSSVGGSGGSSVGGSGGSSVGGSGGSSVGGNGGAGPVLPLDETLRERARTAMVPLAGWYTTSTGLWNMNDWWTSANQLETVIDYSRETGDPTYTSEIDNTFVKNEAGDFDHFGFYDDDGWFAIAWIKAYDLTHQQKYLDMAKTIFQRMTGGWDTKCGGGIYWASAKAGTDGLKNKNAIPNSLFMQVAAKLHQRTPGDSGVGSYLDWAEREWAWFKGSGMLRADKLVVDGLTNLTDCNADGPVFTYNTGVLVGALVDLAASKGNDAELLDEASAVATATMTKMVDANSTLKEAPCGGDICTQFKGVFMRNLRLLYSVRPTPTAQAFMKHQSDQLWDANKNAMDQFGYEWHLPFDKATASRQSSAIDALVAAVGSSSLNLGLYATGSGSGTPCGATSGPQRAFDGGSRGESKWCTGGVSNTTLSADLGASRKIVGFRLRHAGAGGEDKTWNTRDFELQTSADGLTWATAVSVTGNTADVTTHPIAAVSARYARVHVTQSQTSTEFPATRIYEFEIFGTGL